MEYPELDVWQYRVIPRSALGTPLAQGWSLEVGPSLPVTALLDQTGAIVGQIVGFGLDLNARAILSDQWQAPYTLGDDPDEFARSCQLALGGRFLTIVATDSCLRLYPDCSAQVPLVYDVTRGIAGSTATALYNDAQYDADFDKVLFDKLGVNGEGWFPNGLTAHKNLQRVLSNHVLDLDAAQIRRIWPKSEISETTDLDACVDEIIDLVQAQLEALIKGPKRVALALTAGLDTRSILACARPYKSDLDCLTVVGADRHATDSVMAKKISKMAEVNHITLSRKKAETEARERFIRRGGHCNGDSNSWFHPSIWPVQESHVFVGGLGAEISRGFYWRPDDTVESKFTTRNLLGRMGLPPEPACVSALETWKENFPGESGLQMLDLQYCEDRHCSWYASQFCCDPTVVRQAPLLTTRGVELMLSLPPEWKRSDRLGHEIIKRCWPELSSLPYNSLGRVRDFYYKMRRGFSNPQVAVKKFRKLRAK